METKETENKADCTDRTAEEIEQERLAEIQEKDAAELGTLTDKVLYLMEKISEYGFLTMAEIQRVYTNKTYAYDVMKRLRGRGWIADFDTAMRPATGHYLTPRGYLALAKLGRLRVGGRFRVERYNPFIFRHRMASARVGLALEKHPLVREFKPESLIWKGRRSDADKLCDGEFLYRVPGREEAERVGLEVELTLKNKERLAESFDQLGRLGLDQVWWLCGDETIIKALRHQVIERPPLYEAPRHFFCLMDEFLAAKEHRAALIDAGGQEFSIDPAAPTLLPCEPAPPQPKVETRPISPPNGYIYHAPVSVQPVASSPSETATPLEPQPEHESIPKTAWRKLKRVMAAIVWLLCESWLTLEFAWGMFRDPISGENSGPRIVIGISMVLVALKLFSLELPVPVSPRPRHVIKKSPEPLPWVKHELIEPEAHSRTVREGMLQLASQGPKHHVLVMSLCPSTQEDMDVRSVQVLDATGRPRPIENHVRIFILKDRCADDSVYFDGPLTPGLRLVIGMKPFDESKPNDVLEVPISLAQK